EVFRSGAGNEGAASTSFEMTQFVAPDSRACWAVAVSAAIYVFFAMVLIKSESVLYLGFMDMLQLGREAASWPLTLALILSQLGGPLYGVLSLWVSERVLMIGAALACSLATMACSFVYSLGWVVLLYGIILGLGLACAEVLPFTIVARHFVKYRGTAVGLLFVVTALSGFVSPLVTEALRQAYGFRLCLLILGALLLNMLLGCVFINCVDPDSVGAPCTTVREQRRGGSGGLTPVEDTRLFETVSTMFQQSREGEPLLRKNSLTTAKTKLMRNLGSLASVAFVHISVSRALTVFVMASLLLTAVDYGKDAGLSGYDAVSLVTALALGDLVSRVTTGLVLDSHVVSRGTAMLTGFALQTVALAVMSFEKNYWVLLVCCFLVGLSGGGRIFICTVMVTEEFDEASLSLNLGVMNFITGVSFFARPPVIGYVRDVLGSYDPLYIFFAIANAVFTLTWSINVLWDRRCHLTMFNAVVTVTVHHQERILRALAEE
ncbi:hypothetical protein HPB47_002944, partial [Ixodes persulcatus]